MIMPGEVVVRKGSEVDESTGGRTEGMTRLGAIVGLSERVCASGEFLFLAFFLLVFLFR